VIGIASQADRNAPPDERHIAAQMLGLAKVPDPYPPISHHFLLRGRARPRRRIKASYKDLYWYRHLE
jgi:hypothetical protein